MSEHGNLVAQAKQDQITRLLVSQRLLKQLSATITHLVTTNSIDLSIIDKITTIHQVNEQIDSQLNTDIAMNYALLKELELKLQKMIDKLNKVLNTGLVQSLQSRSELIDRELRILENTLKNIKKSNHN